MSRDLLRKLPSVEKFVQGAEGAPLVGRFGAQLVKLLLRERLDALRAGILDGSTTAVPDGADLAAGIGARARSIVEPAGRRAINATGILLHTGLGRAALSADAVAALGVAGGYSLLQTDPDTGKRSLREEKVESLLRHLTGCEAATVVNNNAAATMLVLHELCRGREAIVSRGQLIEIGGAFRIPDVMRQSGATMVEVGTTNRTHLRDYAGAITGETGALVHVHTSNYRVRGFSGTPDVAALNELGRERGIPVIDDLGSGALVPLADFGISSEPLVRDSLAAGTAVACFSGDKLIGGPQSGIICGRAEVIARLRKNPFARMFRVGKLTLAALETTLAHFVDGSFKEKLPFYAMLATPPATLAQRGRRLLAQLPKALAKTARVEADVSFVGSGSIPDEGIPTRVLVLPAPGGRAEACAAALRTGDPAVFCRLKGDELRFDLRTLFRADLDPLVRRMAEVFAA